MALFNRVTIVGLGFIGGSLGIAIRRKRLSREVVGFSRKSSTLRQAKRIGAIDRGTSNLRQAVRDADLVILATPVDAIIPYARRAAKAMRPGSVLTDVGSTKGRVVRALDRGLPDGISFVGSHPLAGSEQRGISAACATLFGGSTCIVTQTSRTNRRALQLVNRLWRAIADRVLVMDPARHDRLLAAVSHLPHLLAFCLIEAVNGQALALAPRSFLEATRVAKSDPRLWDGILLSNRTAVLAALDRFERRLRQARRVIANTNRQRLHRFLTQAKSKRDVLNDR